MLDIGYVLDFANQQDLLEWMNMVEIVKDNFPGLGTKEEIGSYKQTVIKNINRKSALCVKYGNEIVGIMIFSYNQKCLSCMGVHPEHRRKGIATVMIEKMLSLLPNDVDVWISTFREYDKKGIAPRSLYKKFGFIEDELTVEFGYPHQKFILHRK